MLQTAVPELKFGAAKTIVKLPAINRGVSLLFIAYIGNLELQFEEFHIYFQKPRNLFRGMRAERLREEFPELRKRYWGMHILARGYFVSTVGIDREVINKYVQHQ